MSTLALMRWLEATPERYDAGMRVVTLGRVSLLHEAVAEAAVPHAGARVLEVGCGTGAVTRRLAERGADVVALDQNAEMLEQAHARLAALPEAKVEWLERTASEIDAVAPGAFASVVFSLCLSEMSPGERRYVLAAAAERLRPGGVVVAADEVRAPGAWRRALQLAGGGPQRLLAWLLAGGTSRPIADLRGELAGAGLEVVSERRWLQGTLALCVARRAAEAAAAGAGEEAAGGA